MGRETRSRGTTRLRQAPWLLACLLPLASCIKHLGDEGLAIGVGQVERDCLVPVPPNVTGLGAPVSVEWPGRSLWLWEELTLKATPTEPERRVPAAAAMVGDAGLACSQGVSLLRGPGGQLLSLLALDPEELAENAARTDGKRVALRAVGGFVHGGQATIYYDKLLLGPGVFDAEVLGTGLCTQAAPDRPCERLRPARARHEPFLLWLRPGPSFGASAFVDRDGFAYLHGCQQVGAFDHRCSVARVKPEEAANPAAYRYYDGLGASWKESATGAGLLASGPPLVTAGYNGFLRRYTMVGLAYLGERVEVRVSDRPESAFSDPLRLFDAVKPTEWFVQGGREHAALRREDGRTVAVSYHVGNAGAATGLHLVSFRFDEDYRR